MRAQVIEQGRHLGGRPPYGYRLVDAGPHPNATHAKWGRRTQHLEPDPATAPHVQWMFAQRLAGHSVAGIARELNDRDVPCPSRVDPEPKPAPQRRRLDLRTVAAILANPRYTSRQVWNRQYTDRGSVDAADDLLGQSEARRWNSVQQRVVLSRGQAHAPLVSEEDFVAVQPTSATPGPDDGNDERYLLAGLIRCHECRRILDSHWLHHHAAYRCRHGSRTRASVITADARRPRAVYIHQAKAIEQLADWLGVSADNPHAVVDALLEHDAQVSCMIGGTPILGGAHTTSTRTPVAAVPHQRRPAETPTGQARRS